MRRARPFVAVLAIALVATACTGGDDRDGGGLDTSFAAQMASTWHYADEPQRVQIGILASDANGLRAVSQGTVDVSFSFLGEGENGAEGPSMTATYVPVPGTDASGGAPTIRSGASGVYEAEDVTFDRPGAWRAIVTVEIDGITRELTTDFPVDARSQIPAPGMPALRTDTLTLRSKGVTDGAIDSMADGGGPIPDPELHELSIADALGKGRPALVLFGTPAYCSSRFCGPEVAALQELAAAHPDRAAYIHVEIWKDFDAQPQVVNQGAADWLLRERGGSPEMTEPWLYLIGADGIIVDRWGPLFDPDEVAAALEGLPPMEA